VGTQFGVDDIAMPGQNNGDFSAWHNG